MDNEELKKIAEQQERLAIRNRGVVDRIVSWLEEIRENDHFEENIRKVFQG